MGWEFQVGEAKATKKLEQQLIASETSYYSKKEMSMHHVHSVFYLPRDFRMSPGGGHSPLAAPLVCLFVGFFMMMFWVVVVVFCFLPAAMAPGFWLSSEERFGSILGCLPALSVAFVSLLDMARIFLG